MDNDISAYAGKRRPQYEAMLEAIAGGQVGGILAWHTDRLHRRAVELESFVSLVEEHRVEVQTVDLSTASGRMIARLLGATARWTTPKSRRPSRTKTARR